MTTRMENTTVALIRIATDSFSYVCSQNLYLASFPQVPAGQRVPHGRPFTLLSDAPMQSHRAAFSFPLSLPALSGLAGNPGNNQHSRKPHGLRLWGAGSGFWVWRQVAPALGNSTHRDRSNLLIPSSNQRGLGGVLGLLQLLCPTGTRLGPPESLGPAWPLVPQAGVHPPALSNCIL